MKLKEDQARIKDLLKDTITLLCKNGLHYRAGFSVEALIGITLDEEDVFLVNIKETIKNEETKESQLEVSVQRAGEEDTDDEERYPPKKTQRSRKRPPDASPGASDLPSPAKHSRTEPDETSNASEMSKDSMFNIKAEPHDDDDLVFIKEEGTDYSASCSQMGNQNMSSLVVGNVRTHQTAMVTHQGFQNPNFSQSFDGSVGDSSLPGMSQWDPSQANLSSGALDSSLGPDGASQQQRDGHKASRWILRISSQELVCQLCGAVFKSKPYIVDHLRGKHGVGQPFLCEHCGQCFESRSTRNRHRLKCTTLSEQETPTDVVHSS